MALYMLYALRTLSIDVATLGIVISLGGLGALAGAFIASTISRWLGFGRAMIAALVIGKAANMFVAFASVAPQYGVAWLSASQLLSDGAMVAFLILANSYRQAVLPLDVMARANGLLEVMTRSAVAARRADRRRAGESDLGHRRRLGRLRARPVRRAAAAATAGHDAGCAGGICRAFGLSAVAMRDGAVYLRASNAPTGISIARFDTAARRIP